MLRLPRVPDAIFYGFWIIVAMLSFSFGMSILCAKDQITEIPLDYTVHVIRNNYPLWWKMGDIRNNHDNTLAYVNWSTNKNIGWILIFFSVFVGVSLVYTYIHEKHEQRHR